MRKADDFLSMIISKSRHFSLQPPELALTTFVNPWSYLVLRKNKELLREFDRVYFDGISLAVLFSLFNKRISRVSFDMTSLAPLVFEHCEKESLSIAFIGSQEKEIHSAIKHILTLYPGLNIVARRNGYFTTSEQRKDFCEELVKLSPKCVIAGMGTPMQELFLIELKKCGWKGFGYTCGGFFHQTAKRAIYYPKLISALNLRWLYRILDEPKLISRYLIHYPRFAVAFAADLIDCRIKDLFYNAN